MDIFLRLGYINSVFSASSERQGNRTDQREIPRMKGEEITEKTNGDGH